LGELPNILADYREVHVSKDMSRCLRRKDSSKLRVHELQLFAGISQFTIEVQKKKSILKHIGRG
jgi:hypothetical protein